MAKKKVLNPADYIVPLNINGMQGRLLNLPVPKGKKREVLMVAGHHTSLERLSGVVMQLNKYAGVTSPDLPGFGGMDSFYKIGKQPTLDNLADYLAAVVRLRYKNRRRFVIVGVSFGFIVVTRMLQKYPEIAGRVDFVASLVGLVHHEDFALKRSTLLELKLLTSFLQHRVPAWLMQNIGLRPSLIRATYNIAGRNNPKLLGYNKEEREQLLDFEVDLWRMNDTRTHAFTSLIMFNLDLCNATVDVPVYHVAVKDDRYFDNYRVEQHMKVIYSKFELIMSKLDAHVPTVVATAEEAAPFIPPKLKRILNKQ
jgi:pimeloyl-ACP methyl ester carboxylesterase